MKPYPKYKNSGIQWIGQIPTCWDVIRLKYCTDCFDGKRIPVEASKREEGPYPYWGGGGIQSYVNDYLFDEELVLLGEDGAPFFDKQRPVAHHVTNKVWVNNHIHVLKAKNNIEARFLTYALNSVDYSKYIEGSILSKLTQSDMNRIQIPLPPISEQQAIAAYLDDKTSNLDECVRLLELQKADLTDYRKAIISETVTRGLNPNTKLKDSSIEGIEQIPAHWKEVKTLYALSMPITDGPHETPKFCEEGIPFVSAEAVSCGNGKIDFNHITGYITEAFYDMCCKKYIPALNDIYMIKSGATTGRVAIVDTDRVFTIWSPLAVFRTNPDIMNYKFLYYFLQSNPYQKQVQKGWSYGTQQNIGMRTLEKLKILVPPLSEQQAIADYLDTKTAKIDEAIKRIDEQINDLRAYRTALISDVVTGKIDVRN